MSTDLYIFYTIFLQRLQPLFSFFLTKTSFESQPKGRKNSQFEIEAGKTLDENMVSAYCMLKVVRS
jgi:hypothetical protein